MRKGWCHTHGYKRPFRAPPRSQRVLPDDHETQTSCKGGSAPDFERSGVHAPRSRRPLPLWLTTTIRRLLPGLRANQPFVHSPDGSYAPAMIYTERWTDLALANLRGKLIVHPDLWCTEDTLLRCFWHYRPGGDQGQELFGSIELTTAELVMETMSRPRYEALRSLLESVLGPLPVGKRQVAALAGDPAAVASDTAPLLEEYLLLRAQSRKLNQTAVKDLTREEIREAAKRLHTLDPHGRLVFEDEHEIHLLQDFALYEVRRHGEPVIGCVLRRHPLEDVEGAALSQAISQSLVSLFRIDKVTGEGPVVQDLLEPKRAPLLVADLGLARTAWPGMALVARLLPTQRFAMLSGWGFVVQPAQVEQIRHDLLRIVRTESRRARVSSLIRYCRTTLPSLHMGEPVH